MGILWGRVDTTHQLLIQKGIAKPTLLKSKFTSQVYTAKELDEILSANGFETISRYGLDGTNFVKDTTTNINSMPVR